MGSHFLHQLSQQLGSPTAHFAQNKQVEIGLSHAKTEMGGDFCPLMTDPKQRMRDQL